MFNFIYIYISSLIGCTITAIYHTLTVCFVFHRRHNMSEWHVQVSGGQVHSCTLGVQLPARLREGRRWIPVLSWVHRFIIVILYGLNLVLKLTSCQTKSFCQAFIVSELKWFYSLYSTNSFNSIIFLLATSFTTWKPILHTTGKSHVSVDVWYCPSKHVLRSYDYTVPTLHMNVIFK